jgi:dolichyl-phosphate beta-glucosyltransferase
MNNINKDLSIIIPVLNEEQRLPQSLDKIYNFYLKKNINYPIVIVDACSSDNTKKVVLEFAKQHQDISLRFMQAGLPHGQKGRQLSYAWDKINTKYSIFMDADLATPLEHIMTIKDMLLAANHTDNTIDIIIGIRDTSSSHQGLRKYISNIGNSLVFMAGLGDIKDTQCGFKLLSKELSKNYIKYQRILGWGFDIELLTFSRQNGFDIKTIDIKDWHDIASNKWNSKFKSIKTSLKVFKELLLITYLKNKGYYLK